MSKITEWEIWYLDQIDNAITSAVIRVERARLRKHLRNWATELTRQEEEQTPSIRPPKKK